jgi:hypothetical protein
LPVGIRSSSASARAGRSAKSSIITIAPTTLVIACACGATFSQSFSAPHSSGSKWLKPIQRSFFGSMTEVTASRVAGKSFLNEVCMRNGSSSLSRNWLIWMLYPGWKVEMR